MNRLSKVLVANRGEIAVRVVRTCQRLGLPTVAVYSEADREAPHVLAADEAVLLGPSPPGESYLVIEKLIAAAKATHADAVHPGYGFLSENEAFARACADAGLVFIGPSADAIALMGNKRRAKERMRAAGVPCVPGFDVAGRDGESILREAQALGFPVMVKAAAGGGGRGMRLVHEPSALAAAIESARSEASNAFGDGELIVERAILGGRHVEIQVFADAYGNAVHLGERDCSIQRRHQKVLEESPSPAVTPDLRGRMGEIAVTAARAIAYRGAGTLEFLLAPNGEFYFMEMNTRLQVEHPVTEMVTGIDLVEWQLRVAAGEPLLCAQEAITFSGHAIEARLCAEDPSNGYLPQTGTVLSWAAPVGEGIRVDHAVRAGHAISPFYDAMQAKVIAWGPNRETARRRLTAAIGHPPLLGVTTNAQLLLHVLGHARFESGEYDTQFLDEHADDSVRQSLYTPAAPDVALGAALFVHDEGLRLAERAGFEPSMVGWSSAYAAPIPLTLESRGTQRVTVRPSRPGAYEVRIGDARIEIEALEIADGTVTSTIDGVRQRARYARAGDTLWLGSARGVFRFIDKTWTSDAKGAPSGTGRVCAPMNGRVLRVAARPGEPVCTGDAVVVVEAMKMEMTLTADIDGVVTDVNVATGQQVTAGECLLRIEGRRNSDLGKVGSEASGRK